MSCENACYEAQVNGCSDITLKAGLAASTDYFVIINKIGGANSYQKQISTDVDGFLIIDISDFPAGYFTAGYFNLKLRLATTYAPQPMVFNSISFDCVLIHIVKTDVAVDDTSPISTIQ